MSCTKRAVGNRKLRTFFKIAWVKLSAINVAVINVTDYFKIK